MNRFRALTAVSLLVLGAPGCGATSDAKTADTTAEATDAPGDIGAGLEGLAGLSATVVAEGLDDVAALAAGDDGLVFAATAAFADAGTDAVYAIAEDGAAPRLVIDDLHTPLGLLWHEDELYVASAERIDAYGDFDGAEFATVRTVTELPDGVGEVNGIALGSDGRLVVGISAPCDACEPELDESGAVLSVGTDGSDLAVLASGIRAPIGLSYLPGTDDLFVTMNQRDDLGDATPGDWLAVVTQGEDWGFPDCYGQDDPACSTVPEPVAVLDAHAAVSGVDFVDGGGEVGEVVGMAALVAGWALGEVEAVLLTPSGDGYEAQVITFVSGLENPVPILTTGDGTVLIGDWGTGTIYRIAASTDPA